MSENTVASIRMSTKLYEEIKKEAKLSHRNFSQEALFLMETAREFLSANLDKTAGQAKELTEAIGAAR